ncbi:MAG: M24 family metallopeptidase [Planctomycetota bacterium]|jgi:Xaa-Pro aminopeptidase
MGQVPDKEIKSRLKIIRGALKGSKYGAAVITSGAAVHYYSGFSGCTSSSTDAYLLVTAKKQFLITDSRYTEEAGISSPLYTCILWKDHPAVTAGQLIKKNRVKKAVYDERETTVSFFEKMKKSAPSCKFFAGFSLINNPRDRKSVFELYLVKKALKIAEKSFIQTVKQIKSGMLETEVALELEYNMRRNGADDVAFPTIAAINANSSLPHARPGRRKVKKGAILLIDWGAQFRFYNSDLTRTLFIDNIPKLWHDRYLRVLEAQEHALSLVAPGRTGSDIDKAARDKLKGSDLARYFTHGLGHGVGIDIHERPVLGRRNNVPLNIGEIVTVEPGVYFPGRGGIRIEDMVLIKRGGGEVLSHLPKGLEKVVI